MIASADSRVGFINMGNLPNIQIPDSNTMYPVIEVGSKIQSCKINAKEMMYGIGCVDSRCLVSFFEDNYQGLRPSPDPQKKMLTKTLKK